jgi:hypothetical protein
MNKDETIYSLDYHISKITYPLLEDFKAHYKCCLPCGLSKKKWKRILNKMIWAHKFVVYDMTDSFELKKKLKVDLCIVDGFKYVDQLKKMQEGLQLFADYYRCLWY